MNILWKFSSWISNVAHERMTYRRITLSNGKGPVILETGGRLFYEAVLGQPLTVEGRSASRVDVLSSEGGVER